MQRNRLRTPPPALRVRTGEMAYGAHAVARREGKVLFVRGGAPEEDVEVTVREDRGSFAFADVVSVLNPSPARRVAPCPYLPRCGGCPWQHLDYAAQLAAKRSIVTEQLRRIARLDLPVAPVVPSPRELGYRSRLKLRVENGRVGFHAAASHALVAIDHCLLAEPGIDAQILAAEELASALRTRLRRIEIAARESDGAAVVLSGEAEGGWRKEDEKACRDWIGSHPHIRGLALFGRGWQQRWGDTNRIWQPQAQIRMRTQAGSFTQVNPLANRLLVELVVRLVEPHAGQAVLDLYAGAGNLSLPLAVRGASVLAVEQDPRSAADGTSNAAALSASRCRFWNVAAHRAVEELLSKPTRFDVVLLDPPRSGAAGVLGAVMRLAPWRIVYVSCDPATLARDLRTLSGEYRVGLVQPIDLFPQTYHVETVVQLDRTPAPARAS